MLHDQNLKHETTEEVYTLCAFKAKLFLPKVDSVWGEYNLITLIWRKNWQKSPQKSVSVRHVICGTPACLD